MIRYNINLLKEIIKRDNCNIDLKFYKDKKINRDIIITFICECGIENNKNFRQLWVTRAFCKNCLNIITQKNRKETCLKNLGTEYPSQNKEVKEKIKQSIIKKCNENPNRNEEIKEKRKQTCLQNLGTEYPIHNEEIKEKIKQTIIKNCNENPNRNEEIQKKFKQTIIKKCNDNPNRNEEIQEKRKQTIIKKCNYNPNRNEEVKEKYKNTCLKTLGTDNPSKNKEIQEKKKQTWIKNNTENPNRNKEIKEKRKQTCLQNFGTELPAQNDKVQEKMRQTCLQNFGTEYPMQNEEVFKKAQKTSFSYKEYIFPSGRKSKVQGYEPLAIDLLIKKYDESDIFLQMDDNFPEIVSGIHYFNENDNEAIYFPDIYIESENLIIEVKSTYTYDIKKEKNLCKKEECESQCFNFEFWVFDNKKNLKIL